MQPLSSAALLLSSAILIAGCDTFPSVKGKQLTQEEAQKLEEQKAAKEEARQAADNARRARDRQRDEAKQLREKYERYSTTELRVMHKRYLQLATGSGGRDLNVRVNSWVPSESDKKQMDRVIEIERELLRRWKAGDAEAQLPNFDPSQSKEAKTQ